jgi:hypothetical protein
MIKVPITKILFMDIETVGGCPNYDVSSNLNPIVAEQFDKYFDWFLKRFPEDLEICRTHDIICSGVIGGRKDALIKVYSKLNDMCENSNNSHNIKDQAALIIMIAKNEIDRLKIFSFDDSWTLHCAVGGPTQFFESWGLKNALIRKGYGIPELKEDGVVYTQSGIKYDMVHQFNRVEEWKKIITKEYE